IQTSIDDAIAAGRQMALDLGADEVFITGGGQIYKETLPDIERLYITVLDREYEGDTFFPEFDWNEWSVASEEKHDANPEKDRPAFTIYTLERKA
ncbi:MAG: dihydrofolate reductase, partial [Pseudomonadota bacterium]